MPTLTAEQFAEVEKRVIEELSFSERAPLANPSTWFGFNQTGGLYAPDEVVTKRGWEIYDMMIRRDPRINTYLRFLKYALVSGGWEIIAGDDTPEGERRADEMKQLIDAQFKGKWTDVGLRIASGIHNGVSINEKVHGYVEEGPLRGKACLREFKDCNPAHFNFDQDIYGRLQPDGLVQFWNHREIRHSIADFVIYSHDSEFGNLYGRSILQPVYEVYFSRQVLPRQANVAIDKFGTGALTITVPRGTTLAVKQEILARARKVHGASIYVKEDGETWESTPFPIQGFDSIVKWLDRYDNELAIALLVPATLFNVGSTGSYALSDVQLDVAITIYSQYQQAFDETISEHILKPLDLYNNGPGPHPKHKLKEIKVGGIKALAEEYRALDASGRRPTLEAQARDMGRRADDIEEKPSAPSPFGVTVPPAGKEGDSDERRARIGEGEDEREEMSEGRRSSKAEMRAALSEIEEAHESNAKHGADALKAAIEIELSRIRNAMREESADGRRPLASTRLRGSSSQRRPR